jgi:hypothetical protein
MAQKTRAQLQAQINSLLADNAAGLISATDVRTVDGDNIDSNLNLLTTDITEVEAGYLKGVTSPIQTQIDGKASLTGATFTGAVSATNLSGTNTGDQDISGIATNTTAIATKLSTTGGAMTGPITGNIAITAFRPIITDTSTTINLALGTHEGSFIYSNSATAVTVNISVNSAQDFPAGTEIDLIQAGAGVVTITPATGVTLNGANTAIPITAQWGGATLKQITDNNWIVIGKI